MPIGERVDNVLTVALVVVAVAICGMSIYQATARSPVEPAASRAPTFYKEWQRIRQRGHLIGDSTAKVTIIEFGDFQCPFCRVFHSRYVALKKEFGAGVALVYVQYPLSQHPLAEPAARASECAARFGQFPALHNLLYDKQDSLGLKSWASFAAEAGIRDTARFMRCFAQDTVVPELLKEDGALAQQAGVLGTPTLFINGWRFQGIPDSLSGIVARLASGKAILPREYPGSDIHLAPAGR